MATPTSELASARSAGELSRIRSDMSEALREEIDVEDEKPVRCKYGDRLLERVSVSRLARRMRITSCTRESWAAGDA